MAGKSDFQQDLARYHESLRWFDRALWTIAVYRLGRRILAMRSETAQRALLSVFFLVARVVETFTKMSLPVFAQIGGGLRIANSGLIFVHSNSVIGRNCTLSRGVTIGNAREEGSTPVIGDDVEIGAYAQILGGIRIGDGAKIASMSVVLKDVPAGAVASGIPARVKTAPPLHASAPLLLAEGDIRLLR